jgi:head-tail adaptor
MFNAGAARMKFSFQDVIEGVDAMGAPVQTWSEKCQLHAEVENEQFEVNDGTATGPRRESVKTMTLIVRNAPSLGINSRMRAMDMRTAEIYAITAVRYDAKKTRCFIDIQGGNSKGVV